MCHYTASETEKSSVPNKGLYLVDSGGQYYEGTTDVTRTIVMGELTHEEKLHFTLVLMGMLRLTDAKFLHGCRGINVDYLARVPYGSWAWTSTTEPAMASVTFPMSMSGPTASAGRSFRNARTAVSWRRAC